ncbi:hypothetical protein BN1051_00111 [Arthrobacter saudimassiliensis]|uniref:Uncharacterized protein n=1 Tax=Arthrobacter saudimassiliensis TaxID=1461584 RepID=A0A078MMW5_9MICC|nr:hypothetical protein BN1051_00111 [Arthrobacter saudimassiliensis]
MFIKGNAYLRMVEAPERKGVFAKGCYVYEVMTALDSVQVVTAGQLADNLGVDPSGPWVDLQECQRAAKHLFRDGNSTDWVEYPTAIVVSDASLRSR